MPKHSRILFFIIIFLIPKLLWAKTSPDTNISPDTFDNSLLFKSDEYKDREYLNAWLLFNKGAIDESLKIVKKFCKPNSKCGEGWAVLMAAHYLLQERYEEALNTVNMARPRLEKYYPLIIKSKETILTLDEIENIKFTYYKMFFIRGVANFELENWSNALNDFLIYEKEHKEDHIYEYIAISSYRLRRYQESLTYYKKLYKMKENDDIKYPLAFNIGAINVMLGNVEAAIFWLKIPLGHDKKQWLAEINTDKDFDTIRNNRKFIEFLKQYE